MVYHSHWAVGNGSIEALLTVTPKQLKRGLFSPFFVCCKGVSVAVIFEVFESVWGEERGNGIVLKLNDGEASFFGVFKHL